MAGLKGRVVRVHVTLYGEAGRCASGAAFLLLGGVSTPTAAAVVTGFELWLIALRSGASTSALLADMALAVALIGPGGWWWMRGGSDGALSTFVSPQTRPDAQSS